MSAVLSTNGLTRKFGGLTATSNISFALPHGARHALIGPNGAGKTTFVNLLSGLLTPTSGKVLFDGHDITSWPVYRRARAGLSRTFQINQLFVDFTPLETIGFVLSEASGEGARFWSRIGANSRIVAESVDILTQLGLDDVMHERVGSLPYGKQRLLEIAVAITPKPRVLLLDEPAAGVPEGEREQILDSIAALPDTMALVLIEHDMELVFRFARTISVLVNGALFVEGSAADVARDPRVKQVYLGESVADAITAIEATPYSAAGHSNGASP